MPSPEFFQLQEATVGRYSLDRELGRGGMGVVFLARDVALDRLVAIKLLPPALAHVPTTRARFLREARAAARLSHPHIVPVHAVEEQDALAFFVMAYVDGETLGERVRRDGPLTSAQAARVMQEVAWALAHAHAHGIAHRDVKPDNVMLERGTGRAVVTDFGIARLVEGTDTPSVGGAMGTPQFTSPEQAVGESGDARSDLYSLGATIYYAATGRLPFDGATALALLAQHATAAPMPLGAVRRDVPSRLASLVDRCLAKDPASRPPSADAIAESLREARRAGTEVAPPVRAYLREAETALREAGTAYLAAAVSFGVLLTYGLPGHWPVVAAIVYIFVAGLAGSVGAVRIAQWAHATRALLREGYGHDAVRPALALVEAERAEEEASRGTPARPWIQLGLGAVASAVAVWGSQQNYDGIADWLLTFGSVLVPTITLRAAWDAVRRGPSLWSRVVGSRAGRWLFDGMRGGLPAPSRVAVEGQPTGLVLEHALEELYAALPAGERARFADVPAAVERLRADALSNDTSRRAQAVAALETLRLDLLRLHAGVPVNLTGHLEEARDIGRRIDARLDAEVSAAPTPTP